MINMTLTMHEASVPVFRQMLTNLSVILDKANAHATEQRIDPSVLLQARLYPTMFPLVRQVQIATDHAKGATARLSGAEPPKFVDKEKSIDELKARIARTLKYVSSVPAAKFEGAEARTILLTIGSRQMELQGKNYLLGFALPNFFFHMTTAYDILRHNGLDIGKRDFLGPGA
jgi:hypothetical protein